MALFAACKHPIFVWLWFGQTISRLGDRVYTIALAWWVLDATHSATAMGIVLIASSIPTLVFMLVGGVVADRLPRLTIMLVSDMTRGVLVALMTLLAWSRTLPFGAVVVVSFCFGVMDAFFLPAYSAVIPQILPKAELASANALRTLSARAMSLLGPAIGAALVLGGGTTIAFAINSTSFFLSAACLLTAIPRLRGLAPSIGAHPPRPALGLLLIQFRRDLFEGLATVRSRTWVWLTIVIAGVANFIAGGATSVALRFYVQNTLRSPLLYGGITTVTAAGSILGTIWFGAQALRHRGWVIYGLFMLNVVVISLTGLFPLPIVMLGAMLIYGWCATALGLAWVTALQEYIPNEQMGRVTSVDQLGSSIGDPLSLALAGIMTDRFGALPILTWSGFLAAIVVGTGLLSRSVRALD